MVPSGSTQPVAYGFIVLDVLALYHGWPSKILTLRIEKSLHFWPSLCLSTFVSHFWANNISPEKNMHSNSSIQGMLWFPSTKVEAAPLFLGVQDFTSMSETMKQTDLIFLLTRYLHLGCNAFFLGAGFCREKLGGWVGGAPRVAIHNRQIWDTML